MGNKQVKLGLRLDDKTFTAGSLVTGRVYLSVTQQQKADGLHLLLQGEELSTIAHDEVDSHSRSGHRDYSSTHREIDRAFSSLVHVDVELTRFPACVVTPGQYEFPFEWEIPSNLPSTMRCAKGDSHCEVRYRMTAYLHQNATAASFRGDGHEHSSTQAICVVAQPSVMSSRRPTGIVMDPEVFRIKTCCFDSGQVELGFDVDKTVASPDSSLRVGICGVNESKVEVDCLRAQLIETISWSAHGRVEEERKILTESRIPTTNLPQWHSEARRGLHHHYQKVEMDTFRHQSVETQLLVPSQARDSYNGSVIQVRHSLVITAATPPCHTTVESATLVRLQRKSAHVLVEAATAPPEVDAFGSSSLLANSTQPTFVQADVLPQDWKPQEAHVVSLPVSSAVLLGDDDTEYHQQHASPPHASAPDESMVWEEQEQQPRNNNISAPDESMLQEHQTTALSDLLDVLACNDDPVAVVSQQLNNPIMAATIQNLTPREFVQVLQAANRDMPRLARLLAGAMNENFQCRHVLACIWTLPPQVRMDVMRNVVPLASDLETNRRVIEDELNSQELLHFRAALK